MWHLHMSHKDVEEILPLVYHILLLWKVSIGAFQKGIIQKKNVVTHILIFHIHNFEN